MAKGKDLFAGDDPFAMAQAWLTEAEASEPNDANAIALATPRTLVLEGSVEDGMITYITRTRVFGFPDYTTVTQKDKTLKFHARLRFGMKDMGVNAARGDAWIAELTGSGG